MSEFIKHLKAKTIKSCDIKTRYLTGCTGTFKNLDINNATINNLNVTNINGTPFDCLFSTTNVSGVITEVEYVNGVPQQPANPGNFNQSVLDQLWQLNLLADGVTELDAANGRLRNLILSNFYNCVTCPSVDTSSCSCPTPTYAVFTGSISGNQLTVSVIQNVSYSNCAPFQGTIQIGQRVYGQTQQFLNSVIVSQVSGATGGVGVYQIENDFNDYSEIVPSETMLSISDLGTDDCLQVPLRIYGLETLSVGPIDSCGHLTSAIAYNLNIANKTLGTKLAAVYVQVGWQAGATGSVNVQGLIIDTEQFDPSILSFGEQMNNNVLLDSNLIGNLSLYNTFGGIQNAVLQLVVYVEDGLEVYLPTSSSSQVRANVVQPAQNTGTNYSVTYSGQSCGDAISASEGFILDSFVQPGVGDSVTVGCTGLKVSNTFGSIVVFVPGPNGPVSWYLFQQIRDNTHISLLNIGYVENAVPGTVFPVNSSCNFFGLAGVNTDSSTQYTQPNVSSGPDYPYRITIQFNIPISCDNMLQNYLGTSVYLVNPETDTDIGLYSIFEFLVINGNTAAFTLINRGGYGLPPGAIFTGPLDLFFIEPAI